MDLRHHLTLALAVFAVAAPQARCQPTYKLDVKSEFRPRCRLALDGARIARSAVANDPGFRLQYHFKKDGKTLAAIEGRTQPFVDPPSKDPGTYTVLLEAFYPAYRGGNQQKGEYRAISNQLTYRLEPGNPPRLTRVAVPPPLAVTVSTGAAAMLCW